MDATFNNGRVNELELEIKISQSPDEHLTPTFNV